MRLPLLAWAGLAVWVVLLAWLAVSIAVQATP